MSNKRSSDTLDVELCSLPATKRYISEFMSTRFAALSLRRDVLKEVVADRSKFDALSSNKTAQIIEESQQDVTGLDIESLQKVTFKNLSFGLQSAFPEVLNIAPSTFLSSTKLKGYSLYS
ncbi:hypothetical protein K7432_013482 [Basidiobolus ranarum]|uniref:Uncharacterized protein n=1 Tax=Basidiobolus ranarum TaxID=34480 RepID=A0ABR2WJ98_9FUNG